MATNKKTALALCLLLTVPLMSLTPASAAPAPGWSGSFLLEFDDTGDAFSPDVAVSADGTALAVWVQYSAAHAQNLTFATHFDPDTGWSAPVVITLDRTYRASMPVVAVDKDGNGIAAWRQNGASTTDIWASFYEAGSGWSQAFLVENNDSADAHEPAVAIYGSGSAVVAWAQWDAGSGLYHIWAREFIPPFWAPALQVEFGSETCVSPRLAAEDYGKAVMVYACGSSGDFRTYAASLDLAVDSAWASGTPLSASSGFNQDRPRLAMDQTGNATAIWSQQESAGSFRTNIYTSTWTKGYLNETAGVYFIGSWSSPVAAENSSVTAIQPDIAMDAAGRAYAVWTEPGSSPATSKVWSNEKAPGSPWGTPTLLGDHPGRDSRNPHIAVNALGYAVLVFDQAGYVQAGLLEPYGGWNCCFSIGVRDSPLLLNLDVGIDAQSSAVAVSLVLDGATQNVHAYRYVGRDYEAPALVIDQPSGWIEVDRPFLAIAGRAEAGAVVSVSGQSTVAGSNGAFSILVALMPGQNDLEVWAYDAAGNGRSTWVSANFTDPMVALQANLTAAQGQVSALTVQLLDAALNITLAETAVATAEARLSEVEANASATQADLDAAQADLTAAQGALGALAANQTSLQGRLDAAVAEAAAKATALATAQSQIAALTASLAATNASMASSNARIDALEDGGGGPTQAQVDSANSAASTATMVGVLGALLGAAGIGASIMMGRRGGGGGGGGGSGGQPRASQQAQAPAPASGKGDKGGGNAGGGGGPAEHGGG